jgi:hypothetical protein
MMGAMPTMGSAQQAAFEKTEPEGNDGDNKAGAATDSVTRQHAAHEGLNEVLPQDRQRFDKPLGA